jgi:hypothetical protein
MVEIDEIVLEAQKVLFFNREATYIILSREAYEHLRAQRDAVINFMVTEDGPTFMGRQIAFTYKKGIHIGWGK